MIKVLIIDDQVLFCESLRFIIEQDKEIQVVGYAGNGNEALRLCTELVPDVVLMDIAMPVCDGVEGTRLIKAKYNSIKVMILTTFDDEENVTKALKNGANGYIFKDIKPEGLIQAIHNIAAGMPVIHPKAFTMIINKMNTDQPATNPQIKPEIDLSEREIKIIQLIVDGKSNREIAASLHFSEGSVKNQLTDILERLHLKDRTQLAVFAVKHNLI